MPDSINSTTSTQDPSALYQSALNELNELYTQLKKTVSQTSMPQESTQIDSIMNGLELPTLSAPLKSLSLETLLEAIGDEDRKRNVRSAVDKIQTDGDSMRAQGEEKLEKIKEKLEEMQKNSVLSIFEKIFNIIGIIVGAIAAAATTAIGVMTGNPLLVAAGVLTAITVIDSTVNMATDGKASIAAGIAALCEKCGMDSETAKWVGFGFQMAIMVASVALSFGGAAAMNSASFASKLAEVGSIGSKLAKATAITNVISGINTAGEGAVSIGKAVVAYNVAKLDAENVDIDALLEGLREAIKRNQEFVEAEMEASQALLGKVKEIVQESNDTMTEILTPDIA